MSIHGLEKAVFDIASGPSQAEAYKKDSDAYLARYRLAPDEAHLVKALDVRRMVELDLNPMLVMRLFTTLEGRASLPEYLRRLREQAPPAPSRA